MSRLRSIFQVDLPLSCLFDAPTVAGLAEKVVGAQERSQETAPRVWKRGSEERHSPSRYPGTDVVPGAMGTGLPLHNIPFAIELREHSMPAPWKEV